jgi:tRNA-Thr(GGU) m(6)t(6)A37 methyltransferase TsaA
MRLRPIGYLETPFTTRADCPRNGRQLDPAPGCVAVIDPAFEAALTGLDGFSHLILLYWLGPPGDDRPDTDLVVTPRFADTPRGVFATRAPVRPNPLGLSVVAFDGAEAPLRLKVRYLDCRNLTPLIDIKPYIARTDAEPTATRGWLPQ